MAALERAERPLPRGGLRAAHRGRVPRGGAPGGRRRASVAHPLEGLGGHRSRRRCLAVGAVRLAERAALTRHRGHGPSASDVRRRARAASFLGGSLVGLRPDLALAGCRRRPHRVVPRSWRRRSAQSWPSGSCCAATRTSRLLRAVVAALRRRSASPGWWWSRRPRCPGCWWPSRSLWIGLAVGRGSGMREGAGRVLVAVAAIAAVGTLATQYREGGSAEWGGRYFAVLLPLVVPVAVAGLAAARDRLDPAVARQLGVTLLVGSLAMSTLGILSMRASHDDAEPGVTLGDATWRRRCRDGPWWSPRCRRSRASPGRPSTTSGGCWSTSRTASPSSRPSVGSLAAAGVDRFVLVSPGVDSLARELGLRRVARVRGEPPGGRGGAR